MKLIIIFTTLVLFINFWTNVEKDSERIVTVSGILKEAKCPLSEEQAKKLKGFKHVDYLRSPDTINEIFDEKQKDVIEKTFMGTEVKRRPNGPTYAFSINPDYVVIFENEGCPLNETQLKQLKKIMQNGTDDSGLSMHSI